MVQFVLAVRSVGMLHQRSEYAVRRSRDGNRTRRRLFRSGLPLGFGYDWSLKLKVVDLVTDPSMQGFFTRSTTRKQERCRLLAIRFLVATLISWSAGESLADRPTDITDAQARQSVQWMADLALSKMPRTIEGDKDWGDTKRVWAGVKVHFDGGKLKTHRRWRTPEHGRWIRYTLHLPTEGTSNQATAQIHKVEFNEDKETDIRRWLVESTLDAPVKFEAQIQRWNLGTKLFSVTIAGRMQLRLNSKASIGFETDYSEIPPAMVFDPMIRQANVSLQSFEVDRVSHIGGDLAEGWGEIVQEVIVETYIDHLNKKLVPQLNQAIDKERDGLRLSTSQWFRWNTPSVD